MSVISLHGMEFFSYHGCFDEEQVLGNNFIIDLSIETDTSQAEETDDVNQTINYQVVYNLVKMEMAINSKLLENVGSRIIDTIYEAFPNITNINLTISKLNPPLDGKVDRISVTLSR